MLRLFRRGPLSRLAMVMTVKNEERFLESHLFYHRLLGVERVYLFLDQCTDNTEAIAEQFDWVKIIELDPIMHQRCRWISRLQILCMDQAMQWAREEGFDWLLCCDPDEFCFGCSVDQLSELPSDPARIVQAASLVRMLDRIPRRTEQVVLSPAEVLPTAGDSMVPVQDPQYFTTSWEIERGIWDPVSQTKIPWQGFLGHQSGKSIVRTAAHVQAASPHHWTPDQQRWFPLRPADGPVHTAKVGGLLHYVITNYQHWHEKYHKFAPEPLVWNSGEKVDGPKCCYKGAMKLLNGEQRAEYYQQWVAMPQEQLQQLVTDGQAFASDIVPKLTEYARQLYPASKSKCSKVHWNLVPNPPDEPEQRLVYRPVDLVGEQLQGFFRPELARDKKTSFAWTHPRAGIQLRLPAGDYQLTMQLHRVNKLCPQRVQAYLNNQPLEQPTDKLGRSRHTFFVRSEQFARSGENWLWLEFTPDESASGKRLNYRRGAPIQAIRFAAVDSESAKAA